MQTLPSGGYTFVMPAEKVQINASFTVIEGVKEIPVKIVKVATVKTSLQIGKKTSAMILYSGGTTAKPTVSFTSTNKKVVTVKPDGTITAAEPGTAKIVVSSSDGGIYQISLKVTLAAPKGLKVKVGKKQAKLSWKKVKGAKGYAIYRSAKKKGTYKRIAYVNGSNKLKYADRKLKKGMYYYKVAAYYKKGSKKVVVAKTSVKKANVK